MVPVPKNPEESAGGQEPVDAGTDPGASLYGLWPEDNPGAPLSLAEARQAFLAFLAGLLPGKAGWVFCVGPGSDEIGRALATLGYTVETGNDPGRQADTAGNNAFDAVILHRVLGGGHDSGRLFGALPGQLADGARLLLFEEVDYRDGAGKASGLPGPPDIEHALAASGFVVTSNGRIGNRVAPTFGPAGLRETGKKQAAYHAGHMGFEYWVLKHDRHHVRPYAANDEERILPLFNQVFGQNRTLAHWTWKYRNNPLGGPLITLALEGDEPVAHYSAYPVSLTIHGKPGRTLHVGDTFTVPSRRGEGRGKTNLISRTVRLFHKLWCEGRLDFFYGFNTGRIQKLGKRLLSYEAIAPVHEFSFELGRPVSSWWPDRFTGVLGYSVDMTEKAGPWADSLMQEAGRHYGLLVTRDAGYLRWRYDNHPDFDYHYILLKRFGRVVGWSVLRQAEEKVLLVDALVSPRYAKRLLAATRKAAAAGFTGAVLTGWYSPAPGWWTNALAASGCDRRRQHQQLDLCVTFFSRRFTGDDLRKDFYFTMGDSDLY